MISIVYIDDWKCDQLRWNHFGRKLLKIEPVICKAYYNYLDQHAVRKEFKRYEINNYTYVIENMPVLRYSYTIPSRGGHLTLVHYKGDDSIVRNDSQHIRTCPSVLRELQQATKSPSVVYKKHVLLCRCSLEHQPVLVPRNSKQVSNMQALQRQKIRLSHDAM